LTGSALAGDTFDGTRIPDRVPPANRLAEVSSRTAKPGRPMFEFLSAAESHGLARGGAERVALDLLSTGGSTASLQAS
jgi:hypothetical protein